VKTNDVLAKVKRGEATLGCFVGLGSPNVVELLGHAGVDWLVLETEHNGLDAAEAEHLLRAADTTAAVPIVRVPSAAQVSFIGYGPDYALLATAARAGLEAFAQATG
jgi:2-keto-3-deoxy-L-rhamnonate aldolase RhmA